MTRISVLVPTHDHASTLALAVESVLQQSVRDLEVLIVGDGITDEVRAVAHALERTDDRVRLLDLPKGPHHGEVHRHTAVQEARGEVIAYLCDDDLFMPDHLADLVALLADHDLAQCINGHIDPDGRVGLYVGRLDDPFYVRRLCTPEKEYNFVGITGTAHTRESYERLATPWETTPAGAYPDHHQWRRMLLAGANGMTSHRMTVIGLPTSQGGRVDWSPEERAAELERWAALTRAPDGQERLDRMVAAEALRRLTHAWRDALDLLELRDVDAQRLAEAERRLTTITASRWWRLGKRLRPGLGGREA
ncbi:MAG: glycosyltransferase family A protein [Schumannella sp.]|nr:glycosyltransferase family 2 protein [Microbacteriaceae bacterium]